MSHHQQELKLLLYNDQGIALFDFFHVKRHHNINLMQKYVKSFKISLKKEVMNWKCKFQR